MKSGLTVTKDATSALTKALAALTQDRVLVGVPAQNADREPEPGEAGEINNATLAYIQNNGSPAANIPARPFMEPGIADVKDKIVRTYKAGAQAVMDKPATDVSVIHEKVGLIAQGAIQERIIDGPFEPLKPATLAARRRAGHTGDKPLNVSGQLRRAITYVVRSAKGKGA